jgi:hypothetical protein
VHVRVNSNAHGHVHVYVHVHAQVHVLIHVEWTRKWLWACAWTLRRTYTMDTDKGERTWTWKFKDAISGSGIVHDGYRTECPVYTVLCNTSHKENASTNVNFTYSWTITVHSRNKHLLAYYFHSKNTTERLWYYKRKFVGAFRRRNVQVRAHSSNRHEPATCWKTLPI